MKSRRVLPFIALIPLLSQLAFAGEALWPIHSLPTEQIKKDWDFTPDEKWVDHVQHACVKITPKGVPAGGSGAFISKDGLVITNRHVVVDALSELSNATRDLVHDGFYAPTQKDELDCALQIHVLVRSIDVTDKVKQQLGDNPSMTDLRRLGQQIEASVPEESGTAMFAPYFRGAQDFVYMYETYNAKLVFVPDEGLGAFGGEDDNFCYPRHKLDVAILRAYRKDEPAKSADFFPLSPAGVKDGDQVFVVGNPGMTQRYLPVSQLEYLRDAELPAKVECMGQIFKALNAYMGESAEHRKKAAGDFEHWANQYKIDNGALDFLQNTNIFDRRGKQELKWRDDVAASPKAQKIAGNAFLDVRAACRTLAKNAADRYFAHMQPSRLFGLAQSLNSFARATRGRPVAAIQPQIKSFTEFLDHVLDPSAPVNLEVEKIVLTSWLSAAKKTLPEDSLFLAAALKGQTPAEAAARIMDKADQISTKDKAAAILANGAAGIDDAKIPLIQLFAELSTLADDKEERAAKARYDSGLTLIERALAAQYGSAIPPDASGTLRLGWGKVCGYNEDGKQIPSQTTFQSMLALAAAKENKAPYLLSEKFKAAQKELDLNTPLDFVSTADGAPGSSGAPIFTRDGKLVGVLFDGNRQEVPSIYAYIEPESGGRSIAVHSASVWAALEHVYKTEELVKELKAGQ